MTRKCGQWEMKRTDPVFPIFMLKTHELTYQATFGCVWLLCGRGLPCCLRPAGRSHSKHRVQAG